MCLKKEDSNGANYHRNDNSTLDKHFLNAYRVQAPSLALRLSRRRKHNPCPQESDKLADHFHVGI